MSSPLPSREILEELVRYVMPFGKYKGQLLIKLPEAYLAWFARTSMPRGKLGELIETALVIRHNGLDGLLLPLLDQHRGVDELSPSDHVTSAAHKPRR